MTKYYCDCGSHNGQSIEDFKNGKIIDGIKPEEWTIFAFEPSSRFNDYPHINKAVWVEDGKTNIFISGPDDEGSTIIKENSFVSVTRRIEEVETIDFSSWLKQNVSSEDFVVIKFDIEGAEYAVLDKMIADGADKLVDVFFVEFHDLYMPEEYKKRRKKLEKKLKIFDWHAQTPINYKGVE